jgi:hypothetical protein
MKKSLLNSIFTIFTMVGLAASANAQTLTQASHMPVAGDVFTGFAVDTTGVLPGNAGQGVAWNFANLAMQPNAFTTNFVAPSTTPSAADFPNASVAIHDTTGGENTYIYFRLNGSAYELMGFNAPQIGSVVYSNPMTIINFPVSFSSTPNVNDNFAASIVVQGFPINRSGNITVTADGTGTLTMPNLPFSNVLRTKTEITITDNLGILGTQTTTSLTYDYYWQWYKNPLLTIDVTTSNDPFSGAVTTTKSVSMSDLATSIGLTPEMVTDLVAYPNPTSNYINVNYDLKEAGMVKISVENLMGQQVAVLAEQNQLPGYQLNSFNLDGLSKGIYLLSIQTGNGIQRTKISVQ